MLEAFFKLQDRLDCTCLDLVPLSQIRSLSVLLFKVIQVLVHLLDLGSDVFNRKSVIPVRLTLSIYAKAVPFHHYSFSFAQFERPGLIRGPLGVQRLASQLRRRPKLLPIGVALLLNLKLLFESLDLAMVILAVALLSIVQLHFEVLDFVLHIRNPAFIGLVKVVIADLRQLGGIIGAIKVEALLEHPLLVASVGVLKLPPQPLVVLLERLDLLVTCLK